MKSTVCLILQDPARGGLLRAVGSCLAAALLLRIAPDITHSLSHLSADELPGGFAPMYLMFAALVAIFVLAGNAWTRSSRLALALPLPTLQVWLVRTGSLIAIALLSIATLAVALGLSFDLEAHRLAMNSVIALAAARAAAAVVVLVFVYQLPQSGRDRIPIGPPYVVYLIGATVLTVVVSSVRVTSVAGTLFLLVVAVALGLYLYLRLPKTLSVGPTIEESEMPVWSMPDERDLAPRESVGDASLDDDRKSRFVAVHWLLFRGLKTNILTWFLIGIVGTSAAVVVLEFFKGTNALVALFFLVTYQLPLLQAALESMTPFDPLPISRRVLWAHSVGPIILVAAAGVCVALSVFALNAHSFSQITYSDGCIKVPYDYMQLSEDGRVPSVTAPWGESHRPKAHPLWKGLRLALFDPFEVGAESSLRFVEFQTRRAIEAVYGVPVPAGLTNPDYEAPSKVTDGVERANFTPAKTRGLRSADRNRTSAVALLFLALLTTMLTLNALLQFGSSARRRIFKWASIVFIIVCVAIAAAVAVAQMLGFTEVWYLGALISMGIRSVAHSLPLPTWFLWILGVTFWAGAYLILERVFSTIEFPREKTMNRFAEEY
jgi:hypothetical protein